MHDGLLYIIGAIALGLFMTWGVGANDLANVLSTAMGSKAVSVRQALILALIFETAGAFLASGNVTNTIRHNIINLDMLESAPDILIYGMLAVMLGGSVWMTIASYLGLPVSITNTIVGSIVGFGAVVLGMGAVHWRTVAIIGSTWVTSPIIAAIVSYFVFLSVQKLMLNTKNPYRNTRRRIPYYFFIVGFILSVVTVLKGLQHFGIEFGALESIGISIGIGLLIMALGLWWTRHIKLPAKACRHEEYQVIEKIFAVLMMFTACAMVFAHGSNDVANAVGPMSLIINLVQAQGHLAANLDEVSWVLLVGIFGILLGLLTYGRKVIATVGGGITALTPSSAFAATLAAATVAISATSMGIPISTTQILVGSVLGVGLARGVGALNLRIIRNIFISWIITIPVGAGFTIGFFYLFKWLF